MKLTKILQELSEAMATGGEETTDPLKLAKSGTTAPREGQTVITDANKNSTPLEKEEQDKEAEIAKTDKQDKIDLTNLKKAFDSLDNDSFEKEATSIKNKIQQKKKLTKDDNDLSKNIDDIVKEMKTLGKLNPKSDPSKTLLQRLQKEDVDA